MSGYQLPTTIPIQKINTPLIITQCLLYLLNKIIKGSVTPAYPLTIIELTYRDIASGSVPTDTQLVVVHDRYLNVSHLHISLYP